MSAAETPGQREQAARGPPAESYGPGPGETTNTQAFHSTDMSQTQQTPRSGQRQGTLEGPRVQGPPGGYFGDIEQGASDIYGGFESGAKDVITAVGTGGQEVGKIISTGKGESLNSATNNYLNEDIGLGTGSQTATAGAGIIGYSTPGVAIVKGIGEYNSPITQRVFDIGAGTLSIAPVIGEAAGLTDAGSIGGRIISTLGNPIVRTGIGAGFSATGAAVTGGSPTQIGESAAIGGGVSYFGGELLGRLQTSPVRAPPVAGAETTTIENDTGLGTITEQVVGHHPVDITNFVQDFEGNFPTKGPGMFESEQAPPAVPPSKAAPPSDYAGGIGFGNPGGIRDEIGAGYGPQGGSEVTPGTYKAFEYQTPGTSDISNPGGMSGGGGTRDFGSGGYPGQRGNTIQEQEYIQYPPGSSPPSQSFEVQRYLDLNTTTTPGQAVQGFPIAIGLGAGSTTGLAVGSASALQQGQQAIQQSSIQNQSISVSAAQGFSQGLGSAAGVVSVQQFGLGQSSATSASQSQQQNTGLASLTSEGFGLGQPFPGGDFNSSNYPFPGFSLRTPLPERRTKGKKNQDYAFGVNKNPVGNLLTLGTKYEKIQF